MKIAWQLDDRAWEKARAARERYGPGTEYDRTMTPRYDLLFGSVQFEANGQRLFPTEGGIKVSLLDLVAAMAEEILNRAPRPGAADEPLEVTVLDPRVTWRLTPNREGVTTIECDHGDAIPLQVPSKEVVPAAREFVEAITDELRRRSPDVLDWESVQALRRGSNRGAL